MKLNLNQIATNIAELTGKERSNVYATLKTLLDKIGHTEIEFIQYNNDLTEIVINGIRCTRAKRWTVHTEPENKPVPLQAVKQVHEVELIALATPVMNHDMKVKDQAITDYALSLASMSYESTDPEPTKRREPYYLGDRELVAMSEDGEEFYQGGILVSDEPDTITQEIGISDRPNYGVMTFDSLRESFIDQYIAKGLTRKEAEINANAQLTAFTIANDPELKGCYTKSINGFSFNGRSISFDDKEQEFV
ncbi:hypothetical protein ACKC5Q_05065 [Aeromonas dhakensis]|uniref:hypothetical protein n=1 Tax=Aeromonas dhakensis TaxID=196024 RepID=UPI0038B4B447